MEQKNICQNIINQVLKTAPEGAKAEVVLSEGSKKSVGLLNNAPESYTQAESRTISLSVLLGQKQATCTGEDFSDQGLEKLVAKTIEMAECTPENRDAFMAKKGEFIENASEKAQKLDLYDATPHPDVAELVSLCQHFEKGALSVKGVNKCNHVQTHFNASRTTVMTSEGFFATIPTTTFSAGLNALAGPLKAQVNAYDSATCRYKNDLPDLYELGVKIGEEAASRIGTKPIPSGQMPIVFHRDIAADFVDMFAEAAQGMAVDKGVTFLKDAMDTQVFAKGVTITDDPTLPRGLGSDPCDSDGIDNPPLTLVENGTLKNWFLGMADAKRLNLKPNGRGDGPTNLFMQAGDQTKEELIQGIEYGFYVTGTIGHGHDTTTGDFSRGAEGFLIEKGKLTHPVNEVTIAGNLKDMFKSMTPANDLVLDDSTCAPTLKIDQMTVAGR